MFKKFILILFILFLTVSFAYGKEKQDRILATINTRVITIKDLNERLKLVPNKVLEYYKSKEGRKKILDDLIEEAILLDEAKEKKVGKTKAAKKEMELSRKQVLIALLLKEEVEDKIKVTDKEIKAFYEKNKKYFKKPEKIKVRHILLETKIDAQEVLIKILRSDEKEETFERLAKEKSICPSAKAGGDLDWIEKGNMIKEFDEAAFALKEGQISDVVKTKFGFHIVKLIMKDTNTHYTIEEAREQIIENIKNYKKDKMISNYKDDLVKKKKIVINNELLDKIDMK